ncbi:hypothetical protein ACVB8T_31515 [Streptomyces sp. NRAIS3]
MHLRPIKDVVRVVGAGSGSNKALLPTLRRATWCSATPLCVEARLADAVLAACHACAMLAETSCEHTNMLLDRALLAGTPDDARLGFFADVVDQ